MELRARLGVAHPKLLAVVQEMENTLETPRSCAELAASVDLSTRQLERLALSKAPAPVKAPVNRSFNQHGHPEILDDAMNQASRRI